MYLYGSGGEVGIDLLSLSLTHTPAGYFCLWSLFSVSLSSSFWTEEKAVRDFFRRAFPAGRKGEKDTFSLPQSDPPRIPERARWIIETERPVADCPKEKNKRGKCSCKYFRWGVVCERKIARGQKKMEGEENAFGEFTCYGSGGDCFLHKSEEDGPRALRRDSEVGRRAKKFRYSFTNCWEKTKTCLTFSLLNSCKAVIRRYWLHTFLKATIITRKNMYRPQKHY